MNRLTHLLTSSATMLCLAVALCAPATAAQAPEPPRALPELIIIEEAEAATAEGARIASLQAAFREELSAGNQSAALETAKQLVSAASIFWGGDDVRVSQALINLAILQSQTGDIPSAQENFLSAIAIREDGDNSLISPELINPLNGLAATMMSSDNVADAIPIYERAIHVSHVNEGPNNLEQIPIMDALSRAYYFLGKIREADGVQNNIYNLQRRRFEVGSDGYVDALTNRARWFTLTQNFEEATLAYRRVVGTIMRAHGKEDLRLIEPLVELAFVAPRQNIANGAISDAIYSEGRRAINRAVRVARAHAEQYPRLLPRTLAKQGDFLMFSGASRNARAPYREAWDLTGANPELRQLQRQMFYEPKPIIVQPLPTTIDGKAGEEASPIILNDDRGFVELSFTVNRLGRPADIEVVDSDPPGLMDPTIIRYVRGFLYRPALRDGTPVEYQNVRLRHDYRYSKERLTQRRRERIEATTEAREAAAAEAAANDIPEPAAAPPEDAAAADGAGTDTTVTGDTPTVNDAADELTTTGEDGDAATTSAPSDREDEQPRD